MLKLIPEHIFFENLIPYSSEVYLKNWLLLLLTLIIQRAKAQNIKTQP